MKADAPHSEKDTPHSLRTGPEQGEEILRGMTHLMCSPRIHGKADGAPVPTGEGAPPDDPAGRQASGFSIDAAVTRSVSAPVISAYRAYPIGEASHRCFA